MGRRDEYEIATGGRGDVSDNKMPAESVSLHAGDRHKTHSCKTEASQNVQCIRNNSRCSARKARRAPTPLIMARVHIALVVTSALALRVPLRTPMRRIRQSPLRATNDYLASISAPEPPAVQKPRGPRRKLDQWRHLLGAFYKFTRPHTIRGTMLAAFAGVVKAIGIAKCWQWGLYREHGLAKCWQWVASVPSEHWLV